METASIVPTTGLVIKPVSPLPIPFARPKKPPFWAPFTGYEISLNIKKIALPS